MNGPRKAALLWILCCFCALWDTQRWTRKDARGAVCRTRKTSIIDRPLAKSLIIPPLCDPCMDMEGNKADRQPGQDRLLGQENPHENHTAYASNACKGVVSLRTLICAEITSVGPSGNGGHMLLGAWERGRHELHHFRS